MLKLKIKNDISIVTSILTFCFIINREPFFLLSVIRDKVEIETNHSYIIKVVIIKTKQSNSVSSKSLITSKIIYLGLL